MLKFKDIQAMVDMEVKSTISKTTYSRPDAGRLITRNSCVKWVNQSLLSLSSQNPQMWYRFEEYKVTKDTDTIDFPYRWIRLYRVFYNGRNYNVGTYSDIRPVYAMHDNVIKKRDGMFSAGDIIRVEASFKPSLIPDYGSDMSDDEAEEVDESIVDLDTRYTRLLVLLIWRKYATREGMQLPETAQTDYLFEQRRFNRSQGTIPRQGTMRSNIKFGRMGRG